MTAPAPSVTNPAHNAAPAAVLDLYPLRSIFQNLTPEVSGNANFDNNKGWLMGVYAVGAIAASYHMCNGLFTFCIVWGITVSRGAQNTMWRACMGLFVVMSLGFCVSLLPTGS